MREIHVLLFAGRGEWRSRSVLTINHFRWVCCMTKVYGIILCNAVATWRLTIRASLSYQIESGNGSHHKCWWICQPIWACKWKFEFIAFHRGSKVQASSGNPPRRANDYGRAWHFKVSIIACVIVQYHSISLSEVAQYFRLNYNTRNLVQRYGRGMSSSYWDAMAYGTVSPMKNVWNTFAIVSIAKFLTK